MQKRKPEGGGTLHVRLGSVHPPSGYVLPLHASASVLQLGGTAFMRPVPEAVQPSSVSATGPEVRELTHGTPPQVAPAAMASSSLHVPSQLAGGSNGMLAGAPVLHAEEL